MSATIECPTCHGTGYVRRYGGDPEAGDTRRCDDCRGAGEIDDPVCEAKAAMALADQGFGIERPTVARLLRRLVAEVEALRRHNGPENNDE